MKRSFVGVLLLMLALVGCDLSTPDERVEEEATASSSSSGASVETPPVVTPPERPRFVVHEWGTFTSMVGSEGNEQEGLHHTEELLPSFVYVRDIASPNRKSIEVLPEGVTQKLETPVIYFYSDEPIQAQVEVGFPQGVISEWYPQATAFGPEIGKLEAIAQGTMRWDVELITDREPSLLEVPPEDVWAPSRKVPDATPVRFGTEEERFIFYRGLGRFETALQVESVDTQVTITNESSEAIPAAFLLHVHDGGGAITSLGEIAAGGSIHTSPSPKEIEVDAYVEQASAQIEAALIETGLYPDEARAMVETWSISYFGTPGLRVLYVVPRAWTDALLPITVKPEPDELVRTMIGRVEIMLPETEQEAIAVVERVLAGELEDHEAIDLLGRFAEPRLRRAMALLEDEQLQWECQRLVEMTNW